mmetsp:Transcript_12660/g.25414  ORF Transcript_12660/g.25414 Transcript_12660/m.25414 type:complete len:205 (-) Transcript_12660:1250-1864(-)
MDLICSRWIVCSRSFFARVTMAVGPSASRSCANLRMAPESFGLNWDLFLALVTSSLVLLIAWHNCFAPRLKRSLSADFANALSLNRGTYDTSRNPGWYPHCAKCSLSNSNTTSTTSSWKDAALNMVEPTRRRRLMSVTVFAATGLGFLPRSFHCRTSNNREDTGIYKLLQAAISFSIRMHFSLSGINEGDPISVHAPRSNWDTG